MDEANVVFCDDPGARLDRAVSAPDLHIRVDWQRRDKSLRFTFVQQRQEEGWMNVDAAYEDAVRFAQYLETHLGKIAPGFRRQAAWPSVRHRLKALGYRAAVHILPLPLLNRVRENLSPGQSLTISTNECWIPWELVFDPKLGGFWGEKFVLNRLQTIDAREQQIPWWEREVRELHEVKHVVSVVGDRTGSARLAPSLWNDLLPNLERMDSNDPSHSEFFTVARVVEAMESGAEIIHLTCHGELDHAGERYLRLGPQASENFFYPFDVLPINVRGGLLFLNACSAVAPHNAGLGPWMGLTTFGWVVGLRTNGAVVGTYAPISAVAANDVAQRFYKHFLEDKLTAGESLYQTKQSLQMEDKPYGLVYSLYGDPNLRLSKRPSTRELR